MLNLSILVRLPCPYRFTRDACLTRELCILPTEKNEPATLQWSYGVQFVASDIAWASRWDVYLEMSDVEVTQRMHSVIQPWSLSWCWVTG
jgi:hypothetical protein